MNSFELLCRQDFSMRSLKGEEESLTDEEADAHEEQDILPFQLRRHWEKKYNSFSF